MRTAPTTCSNEKPGREGRAYSVRRGLIAVVARVVPVIARGAAIAAGISAGAGAIGIGVIFLVEARRHAAATPTRLVAVAPARRVGTAASAAPLFRREPGRQAAAETRPAAMPAAFGKGRRSHAGADDNSRDQRRRGNTPGHNATSTEILSVAKRSRPARCS